ncbi:gliding motility lipoprotein GldD [Algivirga pacifica]|uniref:Gliding motility lipoprotein GldD n=1 Tax=Algivirga pacifica TaxID=1162670 RepID=A0ABP9D6R5_9BACT
MRNILLVISIALLIGACQKNEDPFFPKERGYPRVELPQASYQKLEETREFTDYPYTFKYSQYAQAKPDTGQYTEPYWMELYYPDWEATIDISYKPIPNFDSLVSFSNTSNVLTYKHQVRAEGIQEYRLKTKSGNIGMMFILEGEVPSPFQFYVTDSANHFFRAALYFPFTVEGDSLKPVVEFIKQDMMEMMNTVEWQR